MADWTALLEPVAQELLGEPARQTRSGEWRYRRKGSLAVYVDGPRRGTWRDHEAGVGGGVLALLEHIEGVDRAGALAWMRDRGLLDGPNGRLSARKSPPKPSGRGFGRPRSVTPAKARYGRACVDSEEYGPRLWGLASPIPYDAGHPARRWLARRNLWRPDLPLPPSVRWLRDHVGPPVGAVVAAFAPPRAGRVSAVQLVHVDAEGLPVEDRDGPDARDKRNHGKSTGAVCVLGVVDGATGVNVVEGLADGLALAARLPWPAVCLGGTAAFRNLDVARWLAGVGSVQLWHDLDAGGAGLEAARALGRAVELFGGAADIERVSRGEDPGAAGAPLVDVDRAAWKDYAADLQRDGLPPWEAARIASIMTVGGPRSRKETRND